MVIVHVIPPAKSGGDRHEERFPDTTSDTAIIAALMQPRQAIVNGEALMLPPIQEAFGRLNGGGLYLSDPRTVVAVGIIDRELSPVGSFIETRRLRGPANDRRDDQSERERLGSD
jgi:hypothetical protein